MPYSRFDTAQLDGSGSVIVSGPIEFADDEQGTTVVASLSFVLVQGDAFVHGVGDARGKGSWSGEAGAADELTEGPAQGYGVALLVRRADEKLARPPVVATLSWSEAITITA